MAGTKAIHNQNGNTNDLISHSEKVLNIFQEL